MFKLLKSLGLTEKMATTVAGIINFLLGKWWLILIGGLIGGGIGYWIKKKEIPVYTATYTFVLSTESKPAGNISGLASQFGIDFGGQNGSEGIFSGDNIVELFYSRRMAGEALMQKIEGSDQTLANLISRDVYGAGVTKLPDDIKRFTPAQNELFRRLQGIVLHSFQVYKKDKKLIFYAISATSKNADIAFYTAKYMLNQTAEYFIDTKTKTSTRSMALLQKEADSIVGLLGRNFQANAELTDRSFNINPSIQSQRSGTLLNQAKTTALAAAYTEVIKNLEIAKINIQKETPLYRIIDEPALPLEPEFQKSFLYPFIIAVMGLLAITALLCMVYFVKLYKQSEVN
jgi:uncharacterized protein involved in exopolysaccharide biosynthesis